VVIFCPPNAWLLAIGCGTGFDVLCLPATSSASTSASSASSSSLIASKGSGPSSYSSDDEPGLSRLLRFAGFDPPEDDAFETVGLSGYTQSRPPFLHPVDH